jgi:hypothetical protein
MFGENTDILIRRSAHCGYFTHQAMQTDCISWGKGRLALIENALSINKGEVTERRERQIKTILRKH